MNIACPLLLPPMSIAWYSLWEVGGSQSRLHPGLQGSDLVPSLSGAVLYPPPHPSTPRIDRPAGLFFFLLPRRRRHQDRTASPLQSRSTRQHPSTPPARPPPSRTRTTITRYGLLDAHVRWNSQKGQSNSNPRSRSITSGNLPGQIAAFLPLPPLCSTVCVCISSIEKRVYLT